MCKGLYKELAGQSLHEYLLNMVTEDDNHCAANTKAWFQPKDWAPTPDRTDGEARLPGPHSNRRRGPRSDTACGNRLTRNGLIKEEFKEAETCELLTWGGCSCFQADSIVIWHLNVQGLTSHAAELVARVRLAERKPDVICLNETFLDVSVGAVPMEGYIEIARWDRGAGIRRGGVAVYASMATAPSVTLVHRSVHAERFWMIAKRSVRLSWGTLTAIRNNG